MNQFFLLGLLLIFTIESFSQNSKFSIEASFPVTVGENRFGEAFNGVIDIGTKFRISSFNLVDVLASINGGLLNRKSIQDPQIQNLEAKYYLIQPRIYGKLKIESLEKIHPMLGVGYTIMILNSTTTFNSTTINQNETESGINLNFGVSYDFAEKIFAQIQYDFVKLKVNDNVPDIKFNTNVNIIKIGIGFRL